MSSVPFRGSGARVALPLAVVLGVAALVSSLGGCAGPRSEASSPSVPARAPTLTAGEIADLIPERVSDRRGWGEVILEALIGNDVPAERTSVCAVVAVIGQESGFQENPVVPGLARIVRARIDRYKEKLGPLGDPLLERLLAGHAPNDPRAFAARLDTVRTERDVDLLFRDLLAYYQDNLPALMEAARWAGKLADLDELSELDPITTAGSMQVSVRFATQWAHEHKDAGATPASVRDALYTRTGGVYYGAARLLGYPSHYDLPLYRFADYNAGYFASRNAAVQAQLAHLTGLPLALDGDLLAYERNGDPSAHDSASERAVQAFAERFAPELTARQIRRDLLQEKALAFENTPTYRAITAAQHRGGRPVEHARLPDLALESPKLTRPLSTAWFARAVDRRYQACMAVQAPR